MAGPYHGKSGAVEVDGTALSSLTSWDVTTSIDTADTTTMAAANSWATELTGLSDFTGTAEGLATSAQDTVALIGIDAAWQLNISEGADEVQLEGNAIMTGLTETVSVDDVGKLSYAFEGNDAEGLRLTAGGTGSTPLTTAGFHGKSARVLWGIDTTTSAMFKPKEWSCSMTVTTADSTAMSGVNLGRTRLSGFKKASATWTNLADDSGFSNSAGVAIAIGDKATLQLWRLGAILGGAYSGPATITGQSASVNKDGVLEHTYTALYDSAITIATT
jgi:hypothetical protein